MAGTRAAAQSHLRCRVRGVATARPEPLTGSPVAPAPVARHVSEARRGDAALQAGRRLIARGERPLYRLRAAQDGDWTVGGYPWLSVAATGCREALTEARAVIAEWLEVPPEAFDVEAPK